MQGFSWTAFTVFLVFVGSVLGIGFPPWTGGVVQYVEGFPGGVAGFVARADALAERYGERFRVPASLRARAAA